MFYSLCSPQKRACISVEWMHWTTFVVDQWGMIFQPVGCEVQAFWFCRTQVPADCDPLHLVSDSSHVVKGNLDTHTYTWRISYEDKGRHLGDASISQGRPKIACKPLEARGEAWQVIHHSSQEEPILPTHWFWTSSLQKFETINFCCYLCDPLLWHP